MLGVTAEVLQANIDWNWHFCSNGFSLAQNFRYKGSPHQPFFLSEN